MTDPVSHVLTLVASDGKSDIAAHHVKEVGKILEAYNVPPPKEKEWLSKGRAVDLFPLPELSRVALMHLRDFAAADKIDVFHTKLEGRKKKLFLADMDSTIVTGETLDELAEYAGIKDQIADITARAMEGQLDFKEALFERVGLLKGLNASALDETFVKIEISKGARTLIRTMVQGGAYCVLVSGGFTFFTEKVAAELGFHAHHGNVLEIEDGVLAGTVALPILDKHAKLEFLRRYCAEKSVQPHETMTIGDGANDIPMLKEAGLGVGYHPKHAVAEEIPNLILYGDLTAALYAQGYKDTEFVL